jgi:subtilisin family serine protease
MKRGHGFEKWVVTFTALLLLLLPMALPARAEQSGGISVAGLRANAKLLAPDAILADFANGEPETAVIVLLKPTATASTLAARSRISAQVPSEFTVAGAPTFYNLRDESVKTQLRATVTETVGRVIDNLGAAGVTVTHRFAYQFGFSARVTPGALERIVNSPDVLSVEKDGVLEAHLAQGIPLMNGTTVRNTYTGSGLSIAICDTGIDTSHPMLGGGGFPNAKVIGGYDTGDNDADPRPDSVNGSIHGTACAGIAAGNIGTVGDYIGGVAPDAKLYAIKISTGTTGSANNSAMIAGWEWAVTHQNDDPNNPIMIISTSFGGGQFSSTCDSESSGMTTAAANAVAAGITIFASSGNDGYCGSIAWPACISYVNSVGAVYDASFGTYRPCVNASSCALKTADAGCATGYYATDSTSPDMVTSYSNSASFMTLFAPANRAYTTSIVGRGDDPSGNYDTSFGGTSAACPYAAGAAAVLQQGAKAKTGSYLAPAQVRSYLVNNGDGVTDSKIAITKPRINLGRAVNALPGAVQDFTIAASPTSMSISQGGTGNTIITTTVSGGFNNAVSLSAAGLPTGVAATFNPTSIAAPGSGSSTLTLTATAATPAGGYTVTVTGTGGGKTHTATFALTVTSGSGSTTQLFANPDFEAGDVGWSSSNCNTATPPSCFTVINQNNGLGHNTSNWYAMLGVYDAMTSVLYQDVSIPANATSAKLQFWYRISTGETGSTAYDTMSLVVADPATGNITATLHTWSNADSTNGAWVQSPAYDLFAYKGQTVRVRFKAVTDSSTPTTFRVDDATLTVVTAATKQQLSVTIGGTGDCSVNSIPSTIACTKTGGVCTAGFDGGTAVTLAATPDVDSLFGGWSGACTALSGNCFVTMDAPKSATATCDFVQPVRIPGAVPASYPTLQAAFNAAANNDTIQARAYELVENAVLNSNVAVFLKGGHDTNYSSIIGTTTVNGSLTIGIGAATVANFTIH